MRSFYPDDGIQYNHPDLKQNYDPHASKDINDGDDDPMPQVDDDDGSDDDDSDDLYIIGAVCLCVCQQKSLFSYSRDLVISPVSRHIPYSKNLVVSPVYRHFPYSRYLKVSRNSKTTKSPEIMTLQGIWSFLLFLDTFRIQGILSFLLFLDTFGKGWKLRRL